MVAAAVVNVNSRSMLITEMLDNEHLTGLESFVMQMNSSSSDSKFTVIVKEYSDGLLAEKLKDLLAV